MIRKFWDGFSEAAVSLQCKVTGVMVILTFSVAAMVTGYLLHSSGQLATQNHKQHLLQMASMISQAASASMKSRNRGALQQLADDTTDGSSMLYLIILDSKDRVLASAEHGGHHLLDYLTQTKESTPTVRGQAVMRGGQNGKPLFLDVIYPIRMHTPSRKWTSSASGKKISDYELVGYVRTGIHATGWHLVMANRIDFMVGIGILATVAAIPLGFFMIRHIVSPLDSLADAMLRFSRGKLEVRSSILRQDEIGRLAIAFNRMADQHQHTHERIVRLNEELEKRVALRTQQLRELASRDPLTGLFNRRYFNEMLERRFSEALRYQTDLSCIMIDLDGFKAVNDTFGHHTGDDLLQVTADTISEQLRSSDITARFGGDEFVALLPQTDCEKAHVLGQRIMDQFKQSVRGRFPELTVSMSIGVASINEAQIEDAESLIRTADHAMYAAKGGGKDRIVTAETAWKPMVI